MSREIKFRVWYTDEKIMLSHEEVDASDKDGVIMWGDIFNKDKHLNVEIMQFTGLCDKNGKEIYEGDICVNEFPGTFNGIIVYCAPEWNLKAIKSGNYWDITVGHLEIIGNIYENGELMEATQ
jgi:hypothetical protein